jgi:hypothetical protein
LVFKGERKMRFKPELLCHQCKDQIEQEAPVIIDCGKYYCSNRCYSEHRREEEAEIGVESVAILGYN